MMLKNWIYRTLYRIQTKNLTCVIDSKQHRSASLQLGNAHFQEELKRSGVLENGHMISCLDNKSGEVIGILQFFTVDQIQDSPEFTYEYGGLEYIPKSLLPYTLVSEFIHVDKKATQSRHASQALIKAYLSYFYQHEYYISIGICEPILYHFYKSIVSFKTPVPLIKHHESGFYIVMVMTREDYERSPKLKILVDIVRHEIGNQYKPIKEEIKEQAKQIKNIESPGVALLSEQDILRLELPLLDGLNNLTRLELFKNSTVIISNQRDVLINEYDGSNGLVIIKKGVCDVFSKEKKLATLKNGDLVGIFSFVLGQPRSASVCSASEHVELIVLSKNCEAYISDPEQKAQLWKNISKILSNTIIDMNQSITSK